jgi:hypothetical protein
MPLTPEQLLEMTARLKKLLDTGPLGPRAASLDNALLPGEVVDILWPIIFGKDRDKCEEPGGVFVLGTWKDQPIMTWHLNKMPIGEVISLLAVTVGMIGQRVGRSVIDDMITALTALKERQEMAERTEGQTSQ